MACLAPDRASVGRQTTSARTTLDHRSTVLVSSASSLTHYVLRPAPFSCSLRRRPLACSSLPVPLPAMCPPREDPDPDPHPPVVGALAAQDDDLSSDDSGYGDETALSTASLQSSIFDYEEEHGRSYHAFRRGKYVMPNDEREQERMDLHYHSLRLALNNRHWIAPIHEPRSILDVGTGTGIWAMDVADDNPSSQIIGVDLSPIQPTAVPPNLEFQIMDADEPWDGLEERFDFVHTRLMNGFSIKSWPLFYEQAFASLQPGGWVENQEFEVVFGCDDGSQPPDSPSVRWANLWNQGISNFGLTGRCFPELMKQQMEAAGFINVTWKFHRMPIGAWPKDKNLRQSGLFNLIGLLDGISGLSQKVFTHGLQWTIEEMEVLLMQVRDECKNRRIHSYFPM